MSDEIATAVDVEPATGTTEESNSVSQTEDIPRIDLDQYSSHRVGVKIDGEEHDVSLSEAIAGYQRQADYTRKTQELADQRGDMQFAQAIQTALQNDPEATIGLLAQHYGINRSEAADIVDNFEELDPQDQKIHLLDQRIAQFEEAASKQEVEKEVSRLVSKYSDFDINEVVTVALKHGSTDLEGTYKQMSFDKMMSEKELARLSDEKKQAEESRIVESKRAASVVSGGSSATTSTTSESAESITSISEAWAAAKRQLNANF